MKDYELNSGMGLKIMKYRAEIIDGTFMLTSNRPSGTIITVRMPVTITKGGGRINYGRRRSIKQQQKI